VGERRDMTGMSDIPDRVRAATKRPALLCRAGQRTDARLTVRHRGRG